MSLVDSAEWSVRKKERGQEYQSRCGYYKIVYHKRNVSTGFVHDFDVFKYSRRHCDRGCHYQYLGRATTGKAARALAARDVERHAGP